MRRRKTLTRRSRAKAWVPRSPYAGLPVRGTRICVHASGVKHDGIVHGYSLSLGSVDRFLWLDERPGVLTRVRIQDVDEWANGA